MGTERIQKNTSQTCLQVSESSGKLSEFQLLMISNGLAKQGFEQVSKAIALDFAPT